MRKNISWPGGGLLGIGGVSAGIVPLYLIKKSTEVVSEAQSLSQGEQLEEVAISPYQAKKEWFCSYKPSEGYKCEPTFVDTVMFDANYTYPGVLTTSIVGEGEE